MALGTVGLLRIPIQDKGQEIIALAGLTLPAIGPKGRAHDIDLILALCRDEKVCIHITAIEQMGAREQITRG
jgi:hypothetical protein